MKYHTENENENNDVHTSHSSEQAVRTMAILNNTKTRR